MGRTAGLARAALPLAMLLLAACAAGPGGGTATSPAGTGPQSAAPAGSPASSPAGTVATEGAVSIEIVEEVTQEWIADASVVDPGTCPTAEYDPNSTGYGDYTVAFFRQMDCYTADGGMGLIQVVNYLEFADEAERDKYIATELTHGEMYLVDGLVVVTQGGFNEAFDYEAFFDRLAQACGCGEIKGGAS